jgi:amino acid permease
MDFFKNFKKDKKTSFMGLVQIALMVLGGIGLIGQEDSEAINVAVQTIFDALGGGWVALTGITLTAVGSVFLLFAKDPKKVDP